MYMCGLDKLGSFLFSNMMRLYNRINEEIEIIKLGRALRRQRRMEVRKVINKLGIKGW
jgi:hypothetical protein